MGGNNRRDSMTNQARPTGLHDLFYSVAPEANRGHYWTEKERTIVAIPLRNFTKVTMGRPALERKVNKNAEYSSKPDSVLQQKFPK